MHMTFHYYLQAQAYPGNLKSNTSPIGVVVDNLLYLIDDTGLADISRNVRDKYDLLFRGTTYAQFGDDKIRFPEGVSKSWFDSKGKWNYHNLKMNCYAMTVAQAFVMDESKFSRYCKGKFNIVRNEVIVFKFFVFSYVQTQ